MIEILSTLYDMIENEENEEKRLQLINLKSKIVEHAVKDL